MIWVISGNMKLISNFCYMHNQIEVVNPMGRISFLCYLLLGYLVHDDFTLH